MYNNLYILNSTLLIDFVLNKYLFFACNYSRDIKNL